MEMQGRGGSQVRFMPGQVKFTGKGGFSISREKLLVQLEQERAKPLSAERDEMIAHMEGLLADME